MMRNDTLQPSAACLDLIRKCEGFSAKPYLCPAGIPTIGYGSTRYADGKLVRMDDPAITEEQALAIVQATLSNEYVPAVKRYLQVQVTQGQFDALVDFAYNCGVQNLRTSTLLKHVNAGKFDAAVGEFGKWTRSGGRVLPGLVKRRAMEAALFSGRAV